MLKKHNVRLTVMRIAQLKDDNKRKISIRTQISLRMKQMQILSGILSNYRNYLLIFE